MGHFPNKARKEAERTRLAAKQQAARPPEPKLPRCRCGLTYPEVPIMWHFTHDRWTPAELCCPACVPSKYIPLVAREVTNLPSDE